MKRDRIRVEAAADEYGRRRAERVRDGRIVVGSVGDLPEGRPIAQGAEVLMLGPADRDGWRDVKTLYTRADSSSSAAIEPQLDFEEGAAPASRYGPAQVATPAYREGYDRIFSSRREVGLA